jgi:hypothetical protein
MAKDERKRIARILADLDDDTPEDEAVREELPRETAVLQQFLKACDQTKTKLNQSIENVVSARAADVQTGMAPAAAERVAMQRIQNIYSDEEATVRVGIW